VEFDFVARKMNLFSQDHCPGRVVYWTHQGFGELSFQMPSGPISISNHIKLKTILDGHELSTVVDTGSTFSWLRQEAAIQIFGIDKNSMDVKGCTMYVGLFPCNECAKMIIQSGVETIVYMSDKHAHKIQTQASKKMLDSAGVEYRQYIPKNEHIVINFQDINWNDMNQLPPTPSDPLTPLKKPKSETSDGQTPLKISPSEQNTDNIEVPVQKNYRLKPFFSGV